MREEESSRCGVVRWCTMGGDERKVEKSREEEMMWCSGVPWVRCSPQLSPLLPP